MTAAEAIQSELHSLIIDAEDELDRGLTDEEVQELIDELMGEDVEECDGCDDSAPVLIDIPDERQDSSFSCGAAAFVSVARFFAIEPDTESEAITQLGTSPAAGTPPDAIVRVLEAHGLTTEHHDWFDLDGIKKKHLDASHPVICPVQMYGSPEEYGRADSGHYVVLIGYGDDDADMQEAAGTCKPGERADLTGCSPAREVEDHDLASL